MIRRRLLLAAPAILGGCSVLPTRPYLEKREWPVDVRRPGSVPPRPGAKTLLVRTFRTAPGLEARGLQSLQPDGSVRTDFYEEWSVPPADAIEDSLRRWLAASGLFSAVLAPGSRVAPDYALEAELLALIAMPGRAGGAISRASLGIVLLDLHRQPVKILLQADLAAEAGLDGPAAPAVAASGRAAVALLLGQVEAAFAAILPR